ncbi:restriction endonuclease [Nocardia sp. NPDC048505]|uniref:McrC family protein n=1 Tax=unclassified Nocardia TaxID=2637762 RepID=UPI0033D0A14F
MTSHDLVEHGPAVKIPLTEPQFQLLRDLKVAHSSSRSASGLCTIKPGRKVGSIRLGGVQINIRPKITELNRLLFFIGYHKNPAIWRDEFVRLDKAPGLYPAVAESFVRLAFAALEHGLLRGYRTTAESAAVMRGRIRFREQLSRNYGAPLPMAVEYDDFTVDTAENRLLLLATLRLLNLPDIGSDARQQLIRLRAVLDEITVVPRREGRPAVRPNRLNARYRDVLELSEVILDNSSFDQHGGPLAASGFLFDMWKIYEDFVTRAMAEAMRPYGGRPEFQANEYMDVASKLKFIPDLIWYDNRNKPVAVVDAKYKAERPRGFPEADIYQVLAYCAVLGLKEGHLIYARGNEPETLHSIKTCNIAIHCHALDLAKPPNDLLKDVDSLARRILHK